MSWPAVTTTKTKDSVYTKYMLLKKKKNTERDDQ